MARSNVFQQLASQWENLLVKGLNLVRMMTLQRSAKVTYLGLVVSSALITGIAGTLLSQSEIPWSLASVALIAAFGIVTMGFLFTGSANDQSNQDQALSQRNQHSQKIALYTGLWAVAAYLIYAVGVNTSVQSTQSVTFAGSGIFLGMISLPLLMSHWISTLDVRIRPVWFFCVILLIWAPFDTGLLAPIWPWPEGGAAYILNVWISCVVAISALKISGVELPMTSIGFRIMPQKGDFSATFPEQIWFTGVALAFGFSSGFFTWNPKGAPVWQYPLEALGLYLTVALPEELLFRGLMQPTIEKISWHRTSNPKLVGKWLTAIIFGLSHLNNDPQWDWRYVLLATLAGIAYSNVYDNVYQRTGRYSLAAPALLHTGVDWLWSTFFRA